MSKTITLRVDDDFYRLIKSAAEGERRSISSLLEYSALYYLTNSAFVSDAEMSDILKDNDLLESLKNGLNEIDNGKYEIVG